MLFVLPWLDTSPVRSMRFRPIAKWFLLLLVVDFFVLGWVGGKPAEGLYVTIAAARRTAYYFLYFLVILPLLGRLERPLPLPESIAKPVLAAAGRCPPAPPRSRWRRPDAPPAQPRSAPSCSAPPRR